VLLALGTAIRNRLNLTISQAFEKFKTGQDQMSFEALVQMISFFLGFDLLPEERLAIEGFLDAFARTK